LKPGFAWFQTQDKPAQGRRPKAAGQPKAGFAKAKCGFAAQKVGFYFLPLPQ
jgi:hypothetical protein